MGGVVALARQQCMHSLAWKRARVRAAKHAACLHAAHLSTRAASRQSHWQCSSHGAALPRQAHLLGRLVHTAQQHQQDRLFDRLTAVHRGADGGGELVKEAGPARRHGTQLSLSGLAVALKHLLARLCAQSCFGSAHARLGHAAAAAAAAGQRQQQRTATEANEATAAAAASKGWPLPSLAPRRRLGGC